MTNEETKGKCKGCDSYISLCYFFKYKIIDKCPCLECLVKVMCSISCPERKKRLRVELSKKFKMPKNSRLVFRGAHMLLEYKDKRLVVDTKNYGNWD